MNATTAKNRRLQRVGESRNDYVKRAARAARGKFNELRKIAGGAYHSSFDVRDALLWVESKYTDLGTFGVETTRMNKYGYVDYLNTGDSYELTILVSRNRFMVWTWGDMVESSERR